MNKITRKKLCWVVLATLAFLPVRIWAQGEELAQTNYAIDTLWVLIAACLVFFMQAGFAFLEAGLHSAKNCVHVMMKNAGDFLIATIAFWAVGFAIMFGTGNSWFGTSGFFLVEKTADTFSSLNWTQVPLEAKFFFQLVFAGTAATIVSGAIGGRFKFISYIIFSIIMTTFIYPVVGHWVWGGGWLASLGMYDFAGSSVVHQVGGWAALVGAICVGARRNRFESKEASVFSPHNLPLVTLGVFILWLGWFGFNPGSTMNISSSADLVAHIFVTTNMAAVAGAIVAVAFAYLLTRKFDIGAMFNGLLGGLVAVTAPCAFISNGASLIIGAIGGLLVVIGGLLLEKLKVDDAVGAWPVHGLAGWWGTVSLGLFASAPWAGGEGLPSLGLFYGGGIELLKAQVIGATAIAVFASGASYIAFTIIKYLLGLRVSFHEEYFGADQQEHGYKAYLDLDLNFDREEPDYSEGTA